MKQSSGLVKMEWARSAWSGSAWACVLAHAFASCVTSRRCFNLSVLEFSHLKKGKHSDSHWTLVQMNERMGNKNLETRVTPSQPSVSTGCHYSCCCLLYLVTYQ